MLCALWAQDAIEAALARIAGGEAPGMLAATWEAQRGTLCCGVNWERHSLEELQVGWGACGWGGREGGRQAYEFVGLLSGHALGAWGRRGRPPAWYGSVRLGWHFHAATTACRPHLRFLGTLRSAP